MLTAVVVVTARDPARLSRCLAAVTRGAGGVDHEAPDRVLLPWDTDELPVDVRGYLPRF